MSGRAMPVAILAASVFGASSLGCGDLPTGADLVGDWGGDHIALTITVTAASIEYDCAHGTIDEPITVDAGGRFEASGTHVFEHGGPLRADDPPDVHPAVYRGVTDGETISMSVFVTDTDQRLGPFQVVRDTTPRLLKCL